MIKREGEKKILSEEEQKKLDQLKKEFEAILKDPKTRKRVEAFNRKVHDIPLKDLIRPFTI